MNTKYAKIDENGMLRYAQKVIKLTEDKIVSSMVYDEFDEEGNPVGEPHEEKTVIKGNGHTIVNPTDAQLRQAGYKPVLWEMSPEPREGGHWEESTPVDDGNNIVIGWEWVEDGPVVQAPRKFSKLKLYAVLTRMGLWNSLVTWMEGTVIDGISVKVAFDLAQDLTEDNEMFAPYLKMAQNALGVSDDVVEQILSQSILED